jgi:hypothetical protein
MLAPQAAGRLTHGQYREARTGKGNVGAREKRNSVHAGGRDEAWQ